jgi:hypothetical protein
MPELGKAYVQIIPSAEGISGKISSMIGGEAESAGKAGGLSLGNSLVGTLKGVIAAAGIGTVIKETLEAGGNLQQSFGGLDTIYGEAGEAAKNTHTKRKKREYLLMIMLRMLYLLVLHSNRHLRVIPPRQLKRQTPQLWI